MILTLEVLGFKLKDNKWVDDKGNKITIYTSDKGVKLAKIELIGLADISILKAIVNTMELYIDLANKIEGDV